MSVSMGQAFGVICTGCSPGRSEKYASFRGTVCFWAIRL